MKKLLILMLALCLVIPVIALTACDGDDSNKPAPGPTHTHTFWDTWESDDNGHWHAADCGHDVKKDEAKHVDTDKDDLCDVCGYELPPHTITYADEYTKDEDGHYKATTCCSNHEIKPEPHKDADKNGLCDVCGYGEEIVQKEYNTITLKAEVGGQLRNVTEVKVEVGTKLTEELAAAIKDATYRGRGFAGWYTDEEFNTPFDYEADISGNITIYGDVGNLAGKEIVWAYDEGTKTLTLTGEGEMFDFEHQSVLPWLGLEITNASIDSEITAIGGYTFYGSSSNITISSIDLHEGITEIGSYAFYGQTTLTEVKFPDSIEIIGADSFRACGLTYIDAAGPNLKLVGEGAFAQCGSATYAVFNEAIDDSAQVFESCNAITHAYFKGNKGQFDSITIGFGNKILDTANIYYFADYEPQKAGPYWHRAEDGTPAQWCYTIKYLPADGGTVPVARDYVFVKNPAITQDNVDFRDNIWFRGYQFDSWTGTFTFTLGAKLTGDISYKGTRGYKVGDGVDYNISNNTLNITGSGKMWDFGSVIATPWHEAGVDVSGITEVVIGSNVTYIGDYAFCNLPALESIEIKSNIVEMSTKAFFGCQNLKYVYYYGNELEAMNCKGLTNQEEAPNLIIYCQELEGEDVKFLTEKGIVPNISYWKDIEVSPAIKDEQGNVKEEAKYTRLTWEFADGVLTIGGEGAIVDYTSSFDTPWGVTFFYINQVEELDFDELDASVEKIVIRPGITAIGNNAFADLYNAAEIVLPDGLKRISATAFNGTAYIDEAGNYDENGLLIIGKNLIKVDADKAGTRVLIPDTVTTIAEGAFADCSEVTAIRIPNILSGANELSYAGLTALDTVFINTTEAAWQNNATKDVLPDTAVPYFFSAKMPTTFGYYWYSLNDPKIWTYWIEGDGEVTTGSNTITVTAEDIAKGCVNYKFTTTEAGTYTIVGEGVSIQVYKMGANGNQIYENYDENWNAIKDHYDLEAATEYAIIITVGNVEAADYNVTITLVEAAAEETPAA